jgi:general secretion pathway protein C
MAGAQTDQDLGLKLVGTAVTDEPGKSIAIIEVQSTGMQGAFHEGYRWRNILIKEIQPGYVVIETQKGEKILYMSSGRAGTGRPPSSGDVAYLDRKEVDSTLPDQSQLTQEIRVRPRFEAGQPIGFVIYKIEPGSIFERMGLRDGDIIVGVNGKPFATTQQTLEFYDALKQGGTVSLEVMRGERKRNLDFVIQ